LVPHEASRESIMIRGTALENKLIEHVGTLGYTIQELPYDVEDGVAVVTLGCGIGEGGGGGGGVL